MVQKAGGAEPTRDGWRFGPVTLQLQLPAAVQLVSGLVVGLRARSNSRQQNAAPASASGNVNAALAVQTAAAATASGSDFKRQILGAVQFGGLLASVAQLNGLVSPQVCGCKKRPMGRGDQHADAQGLCLSAAEASCDASQPRAYVYVVLCRARAGATRRAVSGAAM